MQLVLKEEQVRQGEEQPTQVELTRKREGSRQERQAESEEQVLQGDWQSKQLPEVESG